METDQTAAELAARLQRLPTTRSSWLLVILAAGALVVEALDIGSLGVILPPVRALWHLSPSQVGTLAAASALGIAVGMIPAGRLADRFGRKRLLVTGVVWFCGGTILSAVAANYATLVLIRGLSGLGMTPAFIMPHSIVLDHGNALIFQRNFFLQTTKHRLPDPSEICALDFKGEFRRFGTWSVSATIGVYWSTF